jgi:peroxiredoxin Q/BCP
MLHRSAAILATVLASTVTVAHAQTPAAPPVTGLKVGEMAPDFTLSGSTQEGLLAKPIHLAGFRGQTVVLAFFPKARTKG